MGQVIKRRWVKNGLGIEELIVVDKNGKIREFESSESMDWWYFEDGSHVVKVRKSKEYFEAIRIFEGEV